MGAHFHTWSFLSEIPLRFPHDCLEGLLAIVQAWLQILARESCLFPAFLLVSYLFTCQRKNQLKGLEGPRHDSSCQRDTCSAESGPNRPCCQIIPSTPFDIHSL